MQACSGPSFSQRFLTVCQQLDALQPVTFPTPSSPRPRDASADQSSATSSSLLLPSRDRVCQIFATNECFRPSDELRSVASTGAAISAALASPSVSASVPVRPPVTFRHARRSVIAAEASDARKDAKTPVAPASAVHVPVGGRARVFPSQALQRCVQTVVNDERAVMRLTMVVCLYRIAARKRR